MENSSVAPWEGLDDESAIEAAPDFVLEWVKEVSAATKAGNLSPIPCPLNPDEGQGSSCSHQTRNTRSSIFSSVASPAATSLGTPDKSGVVVINLDQDQQDTATTPPTVVQASRDRFPSVPTPSPVE